MVDPASPSSRPPESSLRDRLGAAARQGPPRSRARLWIWILFGVPVLIIGLLQILGITSSPVADKVLKERQARDRAAAPKPAAPTPATPVEPGAGR